MLAIANADILFGPLRVGACTPQKDIVKDSATDHGCFQEDTVCHDACPPPGTICTASGLGPRSSMTARTIRNFLTTFIPRPTFHISYLFSGTITYRNVSTMDAAQSSAAVSKSKPLILSTYHGEIA